MREAYDPAVAQILMVDLNLYGGRPGEALPKLNFNPPSLQHPQASNDNQDSGESQNAANST